jgi:EAL domain-containing protein (putative c-di-GMP-specific phosphodiesterase class I)
MAPGNGELQLMYQPKMDCFGQRISGVEALLRWNNAGFSLTPGQFIALAEQDGAIHAIGEWVLEECCRQIREWLDLGLGPVRTAVNVSPRQLESSSFLPKLKAALARYRLEADLIELELTEAAFLRNAAVPRAQIAGAAAMGCAWVIDDFGVGFSSLSRLHHLPISKLKLDRSFLNQLPGAAQVADVCNTIIALARKLDVALVVEGIEDPAQYAQLDLNCRDELQGYYFHQPLKPREIEALLAHPQPEPVPGC